MAEIYQALNSDPIDVAALRRMAISKGGLLMDEIRCKVWPKLLSVNTDDLPPRPGREHLDAGALGRRLGGLCEEGSQRLKRVLADLPFPSLCTPLRCSPGPGCPEGQWDPGEHQEECGQQGEGGSPAPLLCSGEAPSAVLGPVLGSPVQER